VRAELGSLRVELQHFRTTIGAATGIDLASH
jgi:hypothetical protein